MNARKIGERFELRKERKIGERFDYGERKLEVVEAMLRAEVVSLNICLGAMKLIR